MKTKKILPLLSAMILTASAAGCSTQTSVSVTFYWNPTQNTEINSAADYESYEYDVYLKPESGENSSYSVDYKDGKYTMTLTRDSEHTDCYRLESTLTISVQYTKSGKKSEWLSDDVHSTVVFKGNNSLQPVYSEKKIRSHSPTGINAVTVETAFATFDYTVTTVYNDKATKASCTRVDNADPKTAGDFEKTFSVPSKHSYFDNEQLAFLLRGLDVTSQLSIYSYNASARSVQTLKIGKDKAASGSYSFAFNGTVMNDTAIDYVPLSLSISSDNPGATQTFHIAKDASGNKYRHAILRMETPLAYQLGTLVYELKNAQTI